MYFLAPISLRPPESPTHHMTSKRNAHSPETNTFQCTHAGCTSVQHVPYICTCIKMTIHAKCTRHPRVIIPPQKRGLRFRARETCAKPRAQGNGSRQMQAGLACLGGGRPATKSLRKLVNRRLVRVGPGLRIARNLLGERNERLRKAEWTNDWREVETSGDCSV